MPTYYKNIGTGQAYSVTGNVATPISALPAGAAATQFANGYMPYALSSALQSGGASTASTQTSPTVTTPYAVPSAGSTTPPIPSSMYAQVRSQIASGALSPQAAQQQLQTLLTSGQYSGSVDTNQLYAPMQVTSNGATYSLNSDGSLKPMNATTQTTNVNSSTGNSTSTVTQPGVGSASGTIASTGNAAMDQAQGVIQGLVGQLASNGQIPAGLQITPQLVGQFLTWAHSVVDPQTQQALSNEATGINTALTQAQTTYQNTQGQALQDFGTQLASQDNAMGGAGVAFSGQRNLADNNLVNTTNRTLGTNAANTNYSISNLLQQGGAALGTSNAGMLNVPTNLSTPTVGLGGQLGTSSSGPSLNFSYNPSNYAVGSIPTNGADGLGGNTAVNNLAANYQTQYSTLAGNNSSKSINDILGMMTGLPSGATTNLN